MTHQPAEVILTTKNTASLTLGIIATVVGVLALLIGWVPFLGLLAVPVAIVGALLALIGVVIALAKKFKGIGMPVLGGVICGIAFIVPIVSTGGTSAAITKSIDDTTREMESARTQLQEEQIRKEHEEAAVKNAYISDDLEIYDVQARYMDSLLDGKVPGVLFKIRNKGAKSLDKVEVIIYFKDSTGSVIAEEAFLPVLVSEYSFSGDNKPLKPGYVWQMESGKFYSAKSVPTEWNEGNIEASITDIRFSEAE